METAEKAEEKLEHSERDRSVAVCSRKSEKRFLRPKTEQEARAISFSGTARRKHEQQKEAECEQAIQSQQMEASTNPQSKKEESLMLQLRRATKRQSLDAAETMKSAMQKEDAEEEAEIQVIGAMEMTWARQETSTQQEKKKKKNRKSKMLASATEASAATRSAALATVGCEEMNLRTTNAFSSRSSSSQVISPADNSP